MDFIDRFEARSNEDGQLSHEETLALIRDTLMLIPSAELDIDEWGDAHAAGPLLVIETHAPGTSIVSETVRRVSFPGSCMVEGIASWIVRVV